MCVCVYVTTTLDKMNIQRVFQARIAKGTACIDSTEVSAVKDILSQESCGKYKYPEEHTINYKIISPAVLVLYCSGWKTYKHDVSAWLLTWALSLPFETTPVPRFLSQESEGTNTGRFVLGPSSIRTLKLQRDSLDA